MSSRSPPLSVHSERDASKTRASSKEAKKPVVVQESAASSQRNLELPSALSNSNIDLHHTHGLTHVAVASLTGSSENVKKPIVVERSPASSPRNLNLPYAFLGSNIELHNANGPSETAGQPWVTNSMELWMVSCFAIMAMMVSLDALIIVTTLKELSQIYNYKYTQDGYWPIMTYFLLNTAMQRPAVAAMEIFGRRNVLIAGLALFGIGVAFLSATPALFFLLLLGRGIQGAGSGVMVSVVPAVLTEMFPPRRRSRYYCIILFFGATGAALGPALGGVFVENSASWRWIYYISAPFCFVLLIFTPFAVQPVGEILGAKKGIWNIDWTGIWLLSGSLTALSIGMTLMAVPGGTADWRALLALIAGGIGMIGTAFYERSGTSKPLISFDVMKVSPITFICVFIHSLVMFTQIFFVPTYLTDVRGLSPSCVGASLVPLTSASLLVTGIIGVITARFRPYRWAIWSGWALTIGSSACMSIFRTGTSFVTCVIILIIAGLGHGLTMSASHTTIQRLAPPSHIRDASLLVHFVRTIGLCLAVAAAGTAYRNRVYSNLGQSEVPGIVANLGLNEVYWRLPKVNTPKGFVEGWKEVYAASFRDLMLATTVLAGLGTLLSLCVGWRKGR